MYWICINIFGDNLVTMGFDGFVSIFFIFFSSNLNVFKFQVFRDVFFSFFFYSITLDKTTAFNVTRWILITIKLVVWSSGCVEYFWLLLTLAHFWCSKCIGVLKVDQNTERHDELFVASAQILIHTQTHIK